MPPFTYNQFYHFFNRGNNRQVIFPQIRNYNYFLQKVQQYLLRSSQIIAYCLMPNHFHFLIYFKNEKETESFSNQVRNLLSTYTRAINKQENRVGSLFQQNSHVKSLFNFRSGSESAFNCFHYIHQNPMKAGLVRKMEIWPWSSFKDYTNSGASFINKQIAYELLDVPEEKELFYQQSYQVIDW